MTVKPIPTWYAGCKFRSRLEARWAVFFDALGVPWEYEPEGFLIERPGSGTTTPYLPDFRLPECGTWVEVKGHAADLDMSLMYDAAAQLPRGNSGGQPGPALLLLGPIPRPGRPVEWDRSLHYDWGWVAPVRVHPDPIPDGLMAECAGWLADRDSATTELYEAFCAWHAGQAPEPGQRRRLELRGSGQRRRLELRHEAWTTARSMALRSAKPGASSARHWPKDWTRESLGVEHRYGFGAYHKNGRPWFLDNATHDAHRHDPGTFDLPADHLLTPVADTSETIDAGAYTAARSARFEHGQSGASR